MKRKILTHVGGAFILKKVLKKEKIIIEDLMALRPYVKNSLKIEKKKKLINKNTIKTLKKIQPF